MNLTQKQLDPILFRTEETGREIEFTLLDPDGTAYDLTDYELKFTMLKPDGNVIYQDLSGGILTQTEQMTTSRGIGYYAIRVSDQDTLIYTGQGKVVIDDHVITDETLESISEVDGLTFPDDFLTVDSPVAVIDDTTTTNNKTWSSSKIINAIGDAVEDFHDFVIDDNAITTQATWSSDKLYAMFSNIHTYSCTKLWDAGFTPSPGVWLEYDFGENLENYDAIVILFVVSGWEGNNADSVTVYPKIQHLNTTEYYHYIKGTDYGIQFWCVSGTTYGLGSIDGNYPPQYKAVYGIKY